MMRSNGTFTFRNQLLDNIFWSVVWGVPIWTLYEVIYFRAFDTGLSPAFQFSDNPIWFVVFFWVILLWKGFHFIGCTDFYIGLPSTLLLMRYTIEILILDPGVVFRCTHWKLYYISQDF